MHSGCSKVLLLPETGLDPAEPCERLTTPDLCHDTAHFHKLDLKAPSSLLSILFIQVEIIFHSSLLWCMN